MNPTVSILSQSGRTRKIIDPLETTEIPFDVNPQYLYESDILICETPDREMFKTVMRGELTDTKILYRMRGDPYWSIDYWIDNRLKQTLVRKMLKCVDGCVAMTPHNAQKYVDNTHNPTHIIPVSIDVNQWPNHTHTDSELRIVSLTNCNYPPKINPIIEAAPIVHDVLNEYGGEWIIGGKGEHSAVLANGISQYDNIHYNGYINAKRQLDKANIMLHLSYLDALPNAILEGMASQLPVITTDYQPFKEHNIPVETIHQFGNLYRILREHTNATYRQKIGNENEAHIDRYYNHERIGKAWEIALQDHYTGDLLRKIQWNAFEVYQK